MIIYSQIRIGLKGKKFRFYKFATLSRHSSKPELVVSRDSRIKWWGRFLRGTYLDELPQIVNILKGEMSLVGPRPEVPFFHQRFCREIPGWEKRLQVKPGITGWAQIHGATSFEPRRKLKYDLEYIRKKSFWFDVYILFLTLGFLVKKPFKILWIFIQSQKGGRKVS